VIVEGHVTDLSGFTASKKPGRLPAPGVSSCFFPVIGAEQAPNRTNLQERQCSGLALGARAKRGETRRSTNDPECLVCFRRRNRAWRAARRFL